MDKTMKRICWNSNYIVYCIFMSLIALLINSTAASAKTMISDSAGYLTREEASQIENTCDNILQQYDTSVFIITTQKMGKSDDYKKYIKGQAKKVDSKENLIILFISTKKKDGVCHVSCYGNITASLTEKRMEKMAAAVERRVENESYYQAMDIFCNDIIKNLTIKPSLDGFIFQSMPQLIFSLLLGCGVVFYLLYPGKKKRAVLYTYLYKNHSRNLGHLDHFSHMEVNILKSKKKGKAKENE